MRRAAQALVMLGVFLVPFSAWTASAQVPTPSCPDSLGGLPLFKVWDGVIDDAWFGEYGQEIDCRFRLTGEAGDEQWLDAWVNWAPVAQADDSFYCRPEMADLITGEDQGGQEETARMFVDTDRRLVWGYSAWADGEAPEPAIEPAQSLAEDFVRQVEDSAAPCPTSETGGAGSGTTGGDAADQADSPEAGPEADSSGQGGSGGPPVAVGLLVGGLGVTAVAGIGSLLAGRGGGAPIGPPAPTTDVVYGDDDAIGILKDGGQLEEVHDESGTLIGYRPLGDLATFIRTQPQWQPAFATPLHTPNGAATHLAGVAFEEGPDGLIESISVIVRETAGGAAPAGQPEPRASGEPSSDDEPVRGDGIFQALVEPHLDYYRAELETHPPNRPPAKAPASSTSPLEDWLLRPGTKSIGMKEVTQLAPEFFDDTGALSRGPYAGSHPTFEVKGNAFTANLPAPTGSPLPSIKVSGKLSARDGRLVLRDVKVPPDIELAAQMLGQPSPQELVDRVQQALNQRLDAAGSSVTGVGGDNGDLVVKIERFGSP